MADARDGAWSTSRQFDRRCTVRQALDLYVAARDAALRDPTDANLDRWGGAVDRVVAAPASSTADIANKVRTMLVERRSGEGALIAILEDLDGLARTSNAAGGQAVGHA